MDWLAWIFGASMMPLLWVIWDVGRPRYYGDDGRVYRTAADAAEAAAESARKPTPTGTEQEGD